jgi:hypothetical protein
MTQPVLAGHRRNGESVDRREPMSKLRRTLIVGVTLAAMSLTAMTAVAQTSDRDTTTQREVSENWSYYNQATRVPPAELKARMQADLALQEQSDGWTRYFQATRMSPATLKVWTQGKDGADAPTAPPALASAAEPSGEPGWLVVSLGILAAAMAVVAGLTVLAARRAIRTARLGQAT